MTSFFEIPPFCSVDDSGLEQQAINIPSLEPGAGREGTD